jgi:hypothetical protein
MQKGENMNKKSKNFSIKNTISSLYEVEHFLNSYNTFSDAVSILKILKHRKNKKTKQN